MPLSSIRLMQHAKRVITQHELVLACSGAKLRVAELRDPCVLVLNHLYCQLAEHPGFDLDPELRLLMQARSSFYKGEIS
jgi:hypothetical protein